MPKGFKYKGTHWTQRPENKERLIAMLSGKRKRGRRKKQHVVTQQVLSKAEKVVKKQVQAQKRFEMTKAAMAHRRGQSQTTIQLNGWLVTLSHGHIAIEESK